ncbi:2OG-Fe(II) oxygenase [Microdochium bolleyi]|uniref:2OG-Fe(II) oxygenase n=1 Tax=Microdochium bolleyi TaxID=196109 RepID=A0A136J2Y9_9PEZI|nr:2OG-Fe(II) oxygenase [Microdochium bolleyi]
MTTTTTATTTTTTTSTSTSTSEDEALSPSALAAKYGTTRLYLSSGNGPVYRTVLKSPLRDARPSEIPVIDVSAILSSSSSSSPEEALQARRAVAAQVREAATNTGFFYIANHGVSPDVTRAAHAAALEFFRQPLAVKDRANAKQSSFYNGYKPPATQRLNPTESVDVRESFSWQYDPRYDPDVPGLDAIPPEIRAQLRMEDHQWAQTANLAGFKPALVAYWRVTLRLARALIRTFALALDLDEHFFDAKFSHPDANLLLNYYPPLPPAQPDSTQQCNEDGSQKEETVSIGAHTDFQVCTILYQDSVGGLQVLNRDGQWINARPIEGTFVVNIADYLQRITNDRWVSTVHRVQNWSGKERVSIPFFCGFNLNESCGVLDSCVRPGEEKKYDEISCVDWVRRRAAMMHRTDGAKSAD